MNLSTKGRYAARIMTFLAMCEPGQLANTADIAKAEGISQDYAEQILITLRAAGLVRSQRGRAGGFRLALDPGLITILDVVKAVEGPIGVAPCVDKECVRSATCAMTAVWKRANAAFLESLRKDTLKDIAALRRQAGADAPISFDI